MVGKKAARAKPYLETTGLDLFTSAHPSPLVRARFRERWEAIPSKWAKALAVCGAAGGHATEQSQTETQADVPISAKEPPALAREPQA